MNTVTTKAAMIRMNEKLDTKISCASCGKMISENDVYTYSGKHMCTNCSMKAGLFPLEHVGIKFRKEGDI